LYSEPGIEAMACARELLYVYVYVYVMISQILRYLEKYWKVYLSNVTRYFYFITQQHSGKNRPAPFPGRMF